LTSHNVIPLSKFLADIGLPQIGAETLKLQSYGISILRLMGSVYTNEANPCLALQKHSWIYPLILAYQYILAVRDNTYSVLAALQAAKEARAALMLTISDANRTDPNPRRARDKAEVFLDPQTEKIVTGKVLSLAWESTRIEVRNVLR
jgi:hypothetical protein